MTTGGPAGAPSPPQQRANRVAAVFDGVSDRYDQVGIPWFTPIAQRLVDELHPRPGERILDAGCGRGAALFALAGAVGPAGHVTGIDLAPGMVAAVQADLEARGLSQADVAVMDAASPRLDHASFDAIASSLVLFFLPDPGAALSAWHQLLKPGGRLGVSTFGQQDPGWRDVDDVFTPYLPAQLLDARTSGRSGPFSSDAGVESLLTGAGFTHVRTVSQVARVVLRDVQQWRVWTSSHGQHAMWSAVPEDRIKDVLATAAERLEQCRDSNGTITLSQEVRYTLGVSP